MTDTTISDALVFPQDDGTGVLDGNEDFDSAGYLSLLAKYKGDSSYVGEDETGLPTLQFANVDTTNEQVDIESGYAYVMQSNTDVQSGSQTLYDTTLPEDTPHVVILPSQVVDLDLDTDVVNDIWLAVDSNFNDSVYIRHGNGLSAPTDPSVKLGTVDTSTGATTRANDLASITSKSLEATDTFTDASGTPHTGEIEDINHGAKHENGGSDEINVDGLSGDLADEQDPKPHATEHEPGGVDEINDIDINNTGVNLSAHASRHEPGGADEINDIDINNTGVNLSAHASRHENGGVDEINVAGLSGDLADPQDPKAHASSHSADSTDEISVENLGTAGASGFVPTSQGDGTLAMESPGSSTPAWTEDANSPFTGSGASSHTFTLASTYDVVMIIIDTTSTDQVDGDAIRVNGDTGANYFYINNADTQTSAASQWSLGEAPARFQLFYFGELGGNAISMSAIPQSSNTGMTIGGLNGVVNPPLSSITVLDTGSANFTIRARVYGLNI